MSANHGEPNAVFKLEEPVIVANNTIPLPSPILSIWGNPIAQLDSDPARNFPNALELDLNNEEEPIPTRNLEILPPETVPSSPRTMIIIDILGMHPDQTLIPVGLGTSTDQRFDAAEFSESANLLGDQNAGGAAVQGAGGPGTEDAGGPGVQMNANDPLSSDNDNNTNMLYFGILVVICLIPVLRGVFCATKFLKEF